MAGPPLKYTTTVPARRTVTECQELLAAAGASTVTVSYDSGVPSGLRFELATAFGLRAFELPVNAAGVAGLLRKTDEAGGWPVSVKSADRVRYRTAAHAAAVAWRVTRDWLAAQLAIIDAEMATADQVLLPYMLTAPGTTVYAAYTAAAAAELEPGGPP